MKSISIILTIFLTGVVFNSNASAQLEFSGTTMGPIVYRVVVNEEVPGQERVQAGIQEQLDQINQLMSTYIEDSDVSKVNNSPANEWVAVDSLTVKVVQKSLELGKLTDGAFDITVGPAVKRWKFGPDSEVVRFPNDAEVAELLGSVGIDNVEVRESPPAIRKRNDETEIDLSAIAKGFAVDQVASWLESESFQNFMVEVGGEVVVRGEGPKGKWRIGIERPDVHGQAVAAVLELEDTAVATSGDYRNVRLYNGKRISHTIDPKTCRPVSDPPASCSVIASDCMTADAIATAVMVMGAEKGIEFCKRNSFGLNVYQRNSTDEKIKSLKTDDFPIRSDGSSSGNSSERSILPAFVSTLVVFLLVIVGMAVGAIFNNRPITGSCGGIAAQKNEDGSSSCSMCQKPVTDCPELQDAEEQEQVAG